MKLKAKATIHALGTKILKGSIAEVIEVYKLSTGENVMSIKGISSMDHFHAVVYIEHLPFFEEIKETKEESNNFPPTDNM